MNDITQLQLYMFTTVIIALYILNAFLLIGLSSKATNYIETIDFYLKIYVSLYIIFRFNRFRKVAFTELDRQIIFTSGVFLFATTIIHTLLLQYVTEIKSWFGSRFPNMTSM